MAGTDFEGLLSEIVEHQSATRFKSLMCEIVESLPFSPPPAVNPTLLSGESLLKRLGLTGQKLKFPPTTR